MGEAKDIANKRNGELLSKEYFNSYTPLKWKCNVCNHEWKATLGSVREKSSRRGSWCPICSQSISEKVCRAIFENLFNTNFPQKKFAWLVCKNRNMMHLDGYNSDYRLAFEYNGAQHYKFIPSWHKTKENFEKVKARDESKKKLCEEKNYPHFAPHDGICYNCRRNIYQQIDHGNYKTGISVERAGTSLITGCPHCSRTYCD